MTLEWAIIIAAFFPSCAAILITTIICEYRAWEIRAKMRGDSDAKR